MNEIILMILFYLASYISSFLIGIYSPLVKNSLQLRPRNFIEVKLHKAVAESSGEEFPATVESRRVLSGQETEPLVSFNRVLSLRYIQFPIVIKDPVQSLEDISRCKVQLVQDDPMSLPHGLN